MRKFNKNSFINAFFGTIIVSGFFHVVILTLQFIKIGNWDVFNYLRILDLDFFWKEITGIKALIISWTIMIGIYFSVWYFYSNKNQK